MDLTEGSNSAPQRPSEIKKSKNRQYLIIIVVVILAGALLTYYFASSKPMWLEKDAFVELHGITDISNYSVDVVWSYQLLGYNGNYVAFSQYISFESSVMNQENSSIRIIDIRNKGKDFINGIITKTTEQDVDIANLGIKHCMIYEYEGGPVVYIDKDTMWPVKIEIPKIKLDLEIRDTNIPKLQSSKT